MNIFYLDPSPELSAQYQHDKHVVKMVLETTQILSTVCDRYGIAAPYRPTHQNHPSVLWAGESKANYEWLVQHGKALAAEYAYRYGKIHACQKHIEALGAVNLPAPCLPLTTPPQCLPDQFKGLDTVAAYRAYYLAEKVKQSRWTCRDVPLFVKETEMATPEKKVAPASATAPKEAKEKAPAASRGPKGVEDSAKITLLVSDNPKRPGSKAHGRFAAYKTGMTVAEALKAGITTPDLQYDASHEFIKIEGYAPKLAPKKVKKEAAPKAEAAKTTEAPKAPAATKKEVLA